MGRPRKLITVEDKMDKVKKNKGEKWTQAEMETLTSLSLAHGKSGILSKETNKATTTKKDIQWTTVQSMFNSMHPPREKSARFKYILMYLRKDKARERRNNIKTGGGPCPANDDKIPFEVTGPMLELADILGVSVLDGFGSDAPNLLTAKDSLPNSSTWADENPPSDASYTFEQIMNDHLKNLLNDGVEIHNTESVNQIEESLSQVESPHTETEAISPNNVDLPATPFPDQLQFFPTCSQRHPKKRKASSTVVGNSYEKLTSNILRKEYLAEKDRREEEKHAAEMQFESKVLETKLAEMRQIASDRQAESERRAELHAMEIRHKEALFNHQIQLMIAARNALACSCLGLSFHWQWRTQVVSWGLDIRYRWMKPI